MSPASVLIYNITADIWTDNYIPPASYVTPPSANATTSLSPTVSNTGLENVGAIVGGVVGALAVIGTIFGFLLYRRRQYRPIPVKTTLDHKESVGSTPMSGSGSPHANITSPEEELKRMQSLQQPQLLRSPPLAPQDISGLYGYQPPDFYPATTTTTPIPTLNTVQALPNASSHPLYAYSSAVPIVSAAGGKGSQSELNQTTTEPSFAPSPLVYMPADYVLPPMSRVSFLTSSTPVSVLSGGDVTSPPRCRHPRQELPHSHERRRQVYGWYRPLGEACPKPTPCR